MCRRLTELRTIAKGPCALPAVEVSYCAGRCRSRTSVTPEVSTGGLGRALPGAGGQQRGGCPVSPPQQPRVPRAGAVPAEPLRVLQLPPGPRPPRPRPAAALPRRAGRARGAARHPQLPVQQLPG